jgi:ribose transport system substrate-binding protein
VRPAVIRAALVLGGLVVVAAAMLVTWQILKTPAVNANTRITVIFKSTDPSIVFWQIVKAGVETAAKDYGVQVAVIGPKEEQDVSGQIAMVRDAVRAHPAAIVLAADDYNLLVPTAERIRAAGIKLITIDSGLNGDASQSFIATDNEAAAHKAGDLMATLLHDGGDVAIMSYVKGTLTAIQREQGIRDDLARYPGIHIEATLYCDDLEDKAYDLTRRLLTENPHIDGVVALNEVATVGAARALSDLHRESFVDLVGFDNSPVEVRYLQAGVIKGIVLQKPFNMGYLGVEAAIKAIKGEHLDRRVDTGSLLVTPGNLYDRESQKLLFPLIEND